MLYYKKQILFSNFFEVYGMNNISFYKSFAFRVYSYNNYRHTDNSKGIDAHFFARMLSGRARIVTDTREELIIETGDIFYLPMDMRYHSYWYGDPDNDNRIEWESYKFSVFPIGSQKRYKPQKIAADAEAVEILDRLANDKTVSPSSVGYLYMFLSRVLPYMQESNRDPKEALMKMAKNYIAEHPDLKVPELAKYCGMSESGLYAFFQKHEKTTPIGMKNKMKAEEAVVLLQSTNLSVEEISTRLGFNTSAYFRKIIKQQTGKTPMRIRKEADLI